MCTLRLSRKKKAKATLSNEKKQKKQKPHYQMNNSGIVTAERSQEILVVSPTSKLIYQNKPLLMRYSLRKKSASSKLCAKQSIIHIFRQISFWAFFLNFEEN